MIRIDYIQYLLNDKLRSCTKYKLRKHTYKIARSRQKKSYRSIHCFYLIVQRQIANQVRCNGDQKPAHKIINLFLF